MFYSHHAGFLFPAFNVFSVESYIARQNALHFRINPDKISILPNVIDLDSFDREIKQTTKIPWESEQPVVCLVCRLVPQKRVDKFLNIIAKVRNITPIQSVIVGDGPERTRLETIARSLDLLPHDVMFLGQRDDIPTILSSVNLLVLTSDNEGVPNVILEAMAAQLPVVSTKAGDATRLIEDGKSGFLHNLDDIEGMVQNIVRLASDPNLRCKFGEAGRKRVLQCYSYNSLGRKILAIYDTIARELNYFHT